MRVNRYSLADYQVTINVPSSIPGIGGTSISIGGPGEIVNGDTPNSNAGSFVGKITIARNKDAWETEGDRTGSWVHNQNLDKTGTCSIDIRQVSDMIIKLSQVCTILESISSEIEGLTITVDSVTSGSNGHIAVCNDCYIQKIPNQEYGETAAMQTWSFTCGQILFY